MTSYSSETDPRDDSAWIGDDPEDYYSVAIEVGIKCNACFGTGQDRYEDVDCMTCYGYGEIYND